MNALRERDDGVFKAEGGICELGLGRELGGCLVFAVEGEDEGGRGRGGGGGGWEREEIGAKAAGGGDGDGEGGGWSAGVEGVWRFGIGAAG